MKRSYSKKKIRELLAACDELESIFGPANETLCSRCPNPMTPQHKEHHEAVGCCTYCAATNGYFFGQGNEKLGLKDDKEVLYLKKVYKFDPVYDFFNYENKRCGLPRSQRSWSCQNHMCDAMREVLRLRLVEDKVSSLVRRITWLRRELPLRCKDLELHEQSTYESEKYIQATEEGNNER